MGTSRDEAPSVTTYPDYDVIVPPNRLRKAVSKAPAGALADDPVARAEAALAGLSHEFSTWMDAECERLDRARLAVAPSGLTGATRDELFRAAHDIKGEAETFGFPYAGHAADSLCRLIEYTPNAARIPLALIVQHVDAVRAIIRESARADIGHLAGALLLGIGRVHPFEEGNRRTALTSAGVFLAFNGYTFAAPDGESLGVFVARAITGAISESAFLQAMQDATVTIEEWDDFQTASAASHSAAARVTQQGPPGIV